MIQIDIGEEGASVDCPRCEEVIEFNLAVGDSFFAEADKALPRHYETCKGEK